MQGELVGAAVTTFAHGAHVTGILTATSVSVADAPSAATDLTNKAYVDAQDALKLDLAGGTMSGAIQLGAGSAAPGFIAADAPTTVSGTTFISSHDSWRMMHLDEFKSSGKQYIEFTVDSLTSGPITLGVVEENNLDTVSKRRSELGRFGTAIGWKSAGTLWVATTETAWGFIPAPVFGLGDVIGVLLDMDARTLQFSKNGSLINKVINLPGTGAYTFASSIYSYSGTTEVTYQLSTVANLPTGYQIISAGTSASILNVDGTATFVGDVTATSFKTGTEGSYININSATITRPSSITLDPAGIGDATGTVHILGDLQVEGTTVTVDSTTVNIADKNIQIGTGALNDAAADGSGITIDSADGDKTFQYEVVGDNLGSSENLNVASGKEYKIDNTSVLSATTLGSGVVNSSLTSVGTLDSLDVSGALTGSHANLSGIVSATSFVGDVTGDVTGDLTGNVTGNVTGELVGSAVTTFAHGAHVTGILTATSVSVAAAPSGAYDLTNKAYVDASDALKLDLAGGTMSGAINLGSPVREQLPHNQIRCRSKYTQYWHLICRWTYNYYHR